MLDKLEPLVVWTRGEDAPISIWERLGDMLGECVKEFGGIPSSPLASLSVSVDSLLRYPGIRILPICGEVSLAFWKSQEDISSLSSISRDDAKGPLAFRIQAMLRRVEQRSGYLVTGVSLQLVSDAQGGGLGFVRLGWF